MTEWEWTNIRTQWAIDAQERLERIAMTTRSANMATFEKAAMKLLASETLSPDTRAYLVRKLDRQTDAHIKRRLGWSQRRLVTARQQLEGLLRADEADRLSDVSVEILEEFADVMRYK